MTSPEAPRREAWERATSGVLTTAGVVFIVAYAWYVLRPEDPPWLRVALTVVLATTWVAFVLDVLVRIVLTPRGERVRFAVHHPVDVLSAVLPVFRAMRVVDLLRRVEYLGRRTNAAVRTRFVITVAAYAVVFVLFIALATLEAERDAAGATIISFGDAVWWACVTIATVGYGDLVPVTVPGRISAVLLMIGGVAIVGTASATFVSVLTDRLARMRAADDEDGGATAPDETEEGA